MTFDKPKDVTYSEMCIYIDENVYEDSFDESKVYQYLYHIIFMLAQKYNLFSKYMYYDPFALFAATKVYMRLTSKRQFQFKEDGTPKTQKVKSVLNYIKSVIYHLKVDFEQTEYSQTIITTDDKEIFDYSRIVQDSVDKLTLVDFDSTCGNISKTCESFLSTLPYKKNSSEWLNIYVSVMLTFLNSITLSNREKRKFDGKVNVDYKKLNTSYSNARKVKPILFHLPDSMIDYIEVLVRQLRHIVAKDLSDILNTSVTREFDLVESYKKEYYKERELYEDK